MMIIAFSVKGNAVEWTGCITINRKDFAVGGNSMTLANNVDISVHSVFEK